MASVLLLASCGQQGPLVLPDAPKKKHTLPTTPGAPRPAGTGPGQQPEPSPQAPVDAAPTPTPPEEPATASPL